jgi:hypothetical protein
MSKVKVKVKVSQNVKINSVTDTKRGSTREKGYTVTSGARFAQSVQRNTQNLVATPRTHANTHAHTHSLFLTLSLSYFLTGQKLIFFIHPTLGSTDRLTIQVSGWRHRRVFGHINEPLRSVWGV